MKNICIIVDNPNNYECLTPLISAIREDEQLSLSLITIHRHLQPEISLTYITLDTDTQLPGTCLKIGVANGPGHDTLSEEHHDALYQALNTAKPDMAVVTGSSHAAFSAAVAASLNDIPVAHIHGGESEFGPWEEAYGLGITKIAHLHFTSTETYRRRVIGFGEYHDRVFNVGALLANSKLEQNLPSKTDVYNKINLDQSQQFIFISMTPDRKIGSRNEALIAAVMDAASDPLFNRLTFVCQNPGPKGFGQIMKRKMESYVSENPQRFCFVSPDTDIPGVMRYSAAVIGNTDDCVVEGAQYKTPVVCVGNRIKDRDNPGHMIQADMDKNDIKSALAKALCPNFKTRLLFLESPFEQAGTPERIKAVLKAYTPADTAAKLYFEDL